MEELPMRIFWVAVAVLGLAVPTTLTAAEKYQIRHTADLVSVCATEARAPDSALATAFCHGFLVGAYHFYDATTPEISRFICAPDPMPTRTEVMDSFVVWAKANPQHMNENAVETLFRYLTITYSCTY